MTTTDRVLPFVLEQSSTTGTGTFTLSGAALNYRTFLTAFGGSAIAIYTAASSDYSKWEIGYGTVTGATLTRTLLVSSTGALVNFSGSTPFNVYIGSMAYVVNSMLRSHYSTSRPGWLPTMTFWLKDAGSNNVEFYLWDGTSDRKFLTINTSTGTVTYVNTPTLTGANTFTGANEFQSSTLKLTFIDAAGFGPIFYIFHDSSSPAPNDASSIIFRFRNSAAATKELVTISAVLETATAAAENAVLALYATTAGAAVQEALIGGTTGGISMGSPTGGRLGVGKLNALELRKNNVEPLYDIDTVAILEERNTGGTDAGTFTSGAWRTRNLNTETSDADALVTLSSGAMTLGAGTYFFEWAACGHFCGLHQTKLRNTSDSTTVGIGTSADSVAVDDMTISSGWAKVTIATSKVFELQHRCQTTRLTDGLGKAVNFDENNVYARVSIRKLAA